MWPASNLKSIAGPSRTPVWIAMAVIVAASWLYLGGMAASMSAMGSGASTHDGTAIGGGGTSALTATFAMWSVMMVAMMLPTVAPSAAVFSSLSARRDPGPANRATCWYVTGYVASWIAYAAPVALARWLLTHAMLLDQMAQSTSALLSSSILFVAGVYQFTPLKSACLKKCRSPLGYFIAEWRDGTRGALALGLRHGSYCIGCCWALMVVMFVVGAMNLVWMGLFTLLVLSEKVIAPRWKFDRIVGATLVVAALWSAANSWTGI